MTHEQRMALAKLTGQVDGQVMLAKACVRAAFVRLPSEGEDYSRGYRDGNRRKAVDGLLAVRRIQRTLHTFHKKVNYV